MQPLLTLNKISVSFGEKQVLNDVTFELNKGDIVTQAQMALENQLLYVLYSGCLHQVPLRVLLLLLLVMFHKNFT